MSTEPAAGDASGDGVRITLFEGATAADTLAEPLTDLRLAMRAERVPGDPPRPRRALLASLRGPRSPGQQERWALASMGDEAVGFGLWEIEGADNPQLGWLDVFVRPEWRRHGIGARIAAALTDDVAAAGATEIGWAVVGHIDVGRALIDRIERAWGLPCRLIERMSRLDIATLDAADIRRQCEARTAGLAGRYRPLFFADDAFPGSEDGFDVHDFFDMSTEIDNLMPLEDLAMAPEHWTQERWAANVASQRGQGMVIWNFVAQRIDDGRTVGLSNVSFDPDDPWKVNQWATGVRKSEQNQGLGKALKLWMLVKLLDEVPGARMIDTGNAASNAAMIGINNDLGFKEHFREHCYQVGLERWREIVADMGAARA
ncbi:MAG: GNAT family N-acetyltransferase [Ardenticatenales bacterium]